MKMRWPIYLEWGSLPSNRHIYRRGKFGPKFGRRRKGWSLVELGKGYRERHTWGWRLWRYRSDGSCWHVGIYYWDGLHHGTGTI